MLTIARGIAPDAMRIWKRLNTGRNVGARKGMMMMVNIIQLSEEQLKDLGEQIGRNVAANVHCRMFTQAEVSWLKACHQTAARTKSVALATFVGFLVLGLLSIVGAGVIYKIKEYMPK
jgi:hypothetical protein